MNEALRTKIANQFRNTPLGFVRIRRNLKLGDMTDSEVENRLKSIILSTELECVESKGKNFYFRNSKYHATLTINRHSLTVITAKPLESP
jgi:hypothetical protein